MKEIHQRKIFDYLVKNKIENFIGVPDSTMKYFIDQGFKRKRVLIATRENKLIFLIGWRGYLKKDAPEHVKIGKIQPNLLKILDLQGKIITDKNWKGSCNWALKKLSNNESCALIIRRVSL